MEKPKKLHYAWIVLIALCSAQLTTNVAWSATASLYWPYISKELGHPISSIAFYFTLNGYLMAAATFVISRFLKKINVKMLMVVCNIGLACCVLAMSQYTQPWHWTVTGIFTGIFGGSAMIVTPMLTINNWFSKKVGLANGIFWVCGGLGSIIFAPIVSNLLGTIGWRNTYLLAGAFALIAPLLFILPLVKFKPEEKGLKPYGYEENAADEAKGDIMVFGPTEKEAFKSGTIWLTILSVVCIVMVGSFTSMLSQFADTIGLLASAGILLSCYSAGNTVGKFLLPSLVDKFKLTLSAFIGLIAAIIGAALLLLTARSGSLTTMLVGGVILGFGASSLMLVTLLVRSCYGTRDYAKLYSYHAMTQNIVGASALTIYSLLMEGYGVAIAPYILMSFAALAIIFVTVSCKRSANKFQLQ